jgi:hypothetical protein
MRRESVIAGLLCLNLGLLAGLAYVWKQHRTPVVSQSSSESVSAATSSTPRMRRIVHAASNEPETPGRFTWRLLEASDFKQYIANLRAVACPEQTIQDIIIAEVNKLYASRETALRLRPEYLKPWENFGVSQRVNLERQRQYRQLMREKRALLKELLGIDVPQETPAMWASRIDSRYEEAYAKLPEGKRDAVRDIEERLWDQQQALELHTMGFWEPEDVEARRKLQSEYRDALAQALTPDELLDYRLATSSTARNLRSELSAFSASDQEFRELFKLRQQLDDSMSGLDGNNPEANRKRNEAHQQMEAQIKGMLGEERYAEYQRARDWQYRNLSRLAQENGLPQDVAVKAYDMNRLAMEEAGKVRSTPDLTREQRDEMLRQMQSDLDQAMGQLIGKDIYMRYQQNYGGPRVFYERTAPRLAAPAAAPPRVITVP